MSNRASELKREVEFSASLEEKPATKQRHDDGWRSDHEAELSMYFSGDYVGAAGLRSGFGAQLERQRDGVSFCTQGFTAPQPPRGIELGPSARGLDVARVVAALLRMPDVAIEAVRRKHFRPPTEPEMLAAYETAHRNVAVLAAYYRKYPHGAFLGLIGLEPYGMSAPLTEPIVKATNAWLREQRDAELAHAASAATLSRGEAEERIAEWEEERTTLRADLAAYEADGEERSKKTEGAAVIFLAARRSAMKRLGELDATLTAAKRSPQRIDVPAIIRGKWNRAPTYDELRGTLRRANEDGKRLKSPDLRDAAKKLVADAVSAAKRDLGSARQQYSEARRAGRQAKSEADGVSRDARAKARVKAFDERAGLK